ncbi:hypothetical protein GCM10009801_30770 [Streptomyces albiaxialis]|uniref:Uncharacterized protein n=1 Tax=Streptomyces albiaxialis TaxID=329523 RepID=A0ABP5HMU8_9ACTN
MSGGGKDVDGVEWDKESLGLVEKGLKGAIGELKESGSSATDSLQGAGFEELSLTQMEAGHAGLARDFEDFCEKWEWGVRALVQNANGLAERLGLSAGLEYEEDQYRSGTLKIAANSVLFTGNPHASEEQVVKQSYGDILTPDAPDYSADSFRQAKDDIVQEGKDTARSLTEDGMGGMRADLAQEVTGTSDEEAEAQRDRFFGPSAEERAKAEGAEGGGR